MNLGDSGCPAKVLTVIHLVRWRMRNGPFGSGKEPPDGWVTGFIPENPYRTRWPVPIRRGSPSCLFPTRLFLRTGNVSKEYSTHWGRPRQTKPGVLVCVCVCLCVCVSLAAAVVLWIDTNPTNNWMNRLLTVQGFSIYKIASEPNTSKPQNPR